MKSTAVAATLTLTLAGALTACGSGGGKGSSKSGYAEICADKSRNVRVDDFQCLGRTDPNLSWYYVAQKCGQTLSPARGMTLAAGQGSFDRPRKGKVERGGFGSCPSKSSS
ncbi:hypothetical protein [Embleya sp. NBC_00896]|uniref:hypothetical protein n=1 Tax=Embleya sp. NBC_00896 TaxID=2975961 RepID=UPI003867AF85|nr:hypothetical protein OG928_15920 [Embleya sp. NBC_00896]